MRALTHSTSRAGYGWCTQCYSLAISDKQTCVTHVLILGDINTITIFSPPLHLQSSVFSFFSFRSCKRLTVQGSNWKRCGWLEMRIWCNRIIIVAHSFKSVAPISGQNQLSLHMISCSRGDGCYFCRSNRSFTIALYNTRAHACVIWQRRWWWWWTQVSAFVRHSYKSFTLWIKMTSKWSGKCAVETRFATDFVSFFGISYQKLVCLFAFLLVGCYYYY